MPKALLLAVSLLCPVPALASVVAAELPKAELRGTAVFSFLGAPIYEARLFTPEGAALSGAASNGGADFAIELTYQRALSQQDLVGSTLREFRRLGGALPLEAQLQTCFQAVSPGDRYLAITAGADRVNFWRNEAPICALQYPDVSRRFMDIFIGENTRSKAFSRKLRGE